jgi:aryl-alcohol dehydrogenase-like predicted oxidoreductase
VDLSVVGFGGILVMNMAQDHANRLVAEAVERGVNYFDVAPTYGDAELRLGPALRPYRQDVFLACKSVERTAEGARAELERSLERLQTDHFDLYQLHGLTDLEKDVEVAFGKGGALETILQAHKEGRVRHVGFSAHSVESARAAMERYDFDSILFPFNFATFLEGDFGPQVLSLAQEKGVARLALKAMARQHWPEGHPDRETYSKCWYQPLTNPREAELAFRFTLGLPITAAIPPGEEVLFRLALEFATRFQPLKPEEEAQVRDLARGMNLIFRAA